MNKALIKAHGAYGVIDSAMASIPDNKFTIENVLNKLRDMRITVEDGTNFDRFGEEYYTIRTDNLVTHLVINGEGEICLSIKISVFDDDGKLIYDDIDIQDVDNMLG